MVDGEGKKEKEKKIFLERDGKGAGEHPCSSF
jgi:hypothetical protein